MIKIELKTYKVQLDSGYNDFRIVEAYTKQEAKEIVEKTNELSVKNVEEK